MSGTRGAAEELGRALAAELGARRLADGTVAGRPGEPARVDATAWAACAWAVAGERELASGAGRMLASIQGPDGRIPIAPIHPGSSWPTPIALFAWRATGGFDAEIARALGYLTELASQTTPRDPESPVAIDTALAGWPWVERTFGWVAPTSLALMALELEGAGDSARAEEGRRLLLDRQLPSGGWNYGNTLVFDTELLAAPEECGAPLGALAGRVERVAVERSLAHARAVAERVRTPFTLAWTLLALAAWGERPADAEARIAATFARSESIGSFDSADLALLLLALHAPEGLVAAIRKARP